MSETATIFIVDQDKAVQASLTHTLQIAGYAVEAYASCRDFVENFRQPKTACLLLDLHLQDMGAWEPVAFLEERDAAIPVILTTHSGDPNLRSNYAGPGTMALRENPSTTICF
ncbi:MAG: response regulator [Alphaproteobacteria bacterium]|nr:response regulator [Alphaproteobacteria bacterium]